MLKSDSKIFIAYEDVDSFSALSKFDIFAEAPRMASREEMDTVNFSEFWAEKSWGHAVAAVTRADVIVVSLSGRMDLPVPVRRWMDTWPNYNEVNHITLVVVFGTEPAEGPTQNILISYFQQVAKEHGLEFLCHCEGAKKSPADLPSAKRASSVDISRVERCPAFDLLAAPKAA